MLPILNQKPEGKAGAVMLLGGFVCKVTEPGRRVLAPLHTQ